MTTATKSVYEQALRLSPHEREELLQQLWAAEESEASPFAPEVREAWEEEIARRIESLERGEVELIPWEQVRARLQERLDAARR